MEAKKPRILIADDEDGLRLSMAGILEIEGYEVITADNGYDAIEKVKTQSFDMAFLDIKMPGLNGVETFKEIKRLSPETTVVMMTAFAMSELIKEAISEGAFACLSKPFDMDKIINTIKEVSQKPFVMIIDNDKDLSNKLCQRLKESGFHVVTRTSENEGIELVKRKVPDIIFLDVRMDGMDGIETYKKLKEMLGANCPKIVVMSGVDLKNRRQEIEQLGAADFIAKPFDFDSLGETVAKLLGRDNKVKVCIVDDDQDLCDSLRNVLVASGYEVDTAYSGSEVIEKIKKEAFKTLVLDIRLPDINGIEVYEQIKTIDNGVGVIFISGHFSEENISEMVKKNNHIFLQKPFNPESLVRMIERLRAERKTEAK